MFDAIEKKMLVDSEDVNDVNFAEALCAIETTNIQFMNLNSFNTSLGDLEHLHTVISSHGMTPSLLAFTNRDNLLSSVIPQMGCEAFDTNSTEFVVTQEALLTKIKEYTATWFKKSWDLITTYCEKIKTFSKMVGEKIKNVGVSIKNKTFNAAKALKEKFKAHPIKTTLVALAIIAAIAAVITAIWAIALPTSAVGVTTWGTQIRNIVMNGLGKYGFKVNGLDITYPPGFGVTELSTAGELGYTSSTCTSLVSTASSTIGEGSDFAGLGSKISENSNKILHFVQSNDPNTLNFIRNAWNELMKLTRSLFLFMNSKLVTGITTVLNLIKRLFGNSTTNNNAVVPA